MEIANPWLYYPTLVTFPFWGALLAVGIAKGLEWLIGGRR